jgi:hypothetical protein
MSGTLWKCLLFCGNVWYDVEMSVILWKCLFFLEMSVISAKFQNLGFRAKQDNIPSEARLAFCKNKLQAGNKPVQKKLVCII